MSARARQRPDDAKDDPVSPFVTSRGRRAPSFTAILPALLVLVVLGFRPDGVVADAQAQTVRSVGGLNVERLEGREYEQLGKLQVAPVVVNGDILFYVVGIASYPAKYRANRMEERIEALAEDPTYDPDKLHIVETDTYHVIYPDEKSTEDEIVLIHDEDAALEGIGREVVATTFREKVRQTILDYRHDRKPEVILTQSLHGLGRTLVLVALLYGVIWGFRRLDRILERRFKRHIEKLEAKSLRLIQAEQLWNGLRGLLKLLRALIILGLIYVFVNFVLSLFPWTKFAARTLLHYVVDPLQDMAEALIDYIPSLIFLVLLFLIARYVLKAMRGFFLAIGRGSVQLTNFEAEWAIPTYRICRVVVVAFTLVLAYPYIPGSDSEAFKGISIMLGVLFSLGSTSMISNVIAGYAMTYRRAFKIGDRVKIGDNVGDITDRRMLVTHMRTLKNEEVVIPNSTIMNADVTNYSTMVQEQGLILHTTVGIGYEVPWRQVEAMLLMAADRTDGLLEEPKPFVLQKALADFAVQYELNAYCDDEKRAVALYSDLHKNIQDVFNEYGVQIMTPAYERDTPEPKLVPKDQWFVEPAVPPEKQ